MKKKVIGFCKTRSKVRMQKTCGNIQDRKDAAVNILKNEKKIREQYKLFHEKFRKRNRPGKYQLINAILYEWYQKCCACNIYPNGPMLKEEALKIKEKLQNNTLDSFIALEGWLNKWKAAYAAKESWLEMSLEKLLHPGWKDFGNLLQGSPRKIFGI